jgi:RNA polymerase sigma factor (sigma-70 family)
MGYMNGQILRVPVIIRKPVIKKVPVRKDLNFLATAVADEIYNENKKHKKLKFDGQTALYNGIIKLVYKNAYSYSNYKSDFNDLTQSCLHRIWQKLHKFDANRATFSTWAWKVCRNVLNGDYLKKKKIYDGLDSNGDERFNSIVEEEGDIHLQDEIKHVVEKLYSMYPKQSIIVEAMFGDTREVNYTVPDRFCIAEIARRANRIKMEKLNMSESDWNSYIQENPREEIQYMNCYVFNRDHIVPVFKKHFK